MDPLNTKLVVLCVILATFTAVQHGEYERQDPKSPDEM